MSSKYSNSHMLRRKFIRSSLIGGGLISQFQGNDKWVKPVIDVVILPAHAMTSPIDPVPPPTPSPPTPPQSGSQTFLSSGAFTVPTSVTLIEIAATGGAGGGGAGGNAGGNDIGGNGGNGAGGLSQMQPFMVSPGDVLTITIGAGGAGGLPYSATRRANGGGAGEPGLDTIVTGGTINLTAPGGRGGGGGGGAVGGGQTAWQGGPGQDGSAGGQGGLGFNTTNPAPSRDGVSAVGGVTGTPGGGAGGMGAPADPASFTLGSSGFSGQDGQVVISW